MSDNITREPYRNAWYKQLSDAVKKHDEEIAEMTPHLVPEVEEGDNGKILIAGEDGAFDWGQPPEELPIITEGDEGKVLKVDEGVPKWLEDQDAEIPSHTVSDEGKMLSVNAQNGLEWKNVPDEYLVVNITKSGSVYTTDKTYSEMRPFAEKGKIVVIYNDKLYRLTQYTSTHLRFECIMDMPKSDLGAQGDYTFFYLTGFMRYEFSISNDSIVYGTYVYYPYTAIAVTNNSTLSTENFNLIKNESRKGYPLFLQYSNSGNFYLKLSSRVNNEYDFINEYYGIKAHIDTNGLVMITGIPKDLFVYVTQNGTSPNFTYTADHTFAEIHSAVENGRNVYVRLTGTNNIYQLFIYSDTVCSFAHMLPNFISTFNDTENARLLANSSDIDNDTFVIRANGVSRSTVRFCIQHVVAISTASGSLTDRAYWYIVNVPVSIIDYNGYRLNLYYKDNTVYKFRDIANTYECIIDVSTKTYTITTI